MGISSNSTIEAAEITAVAKKKVITFNFEEGGGVLTTGLKKQAAWFPVDTDGPTNWTVDAVVIMGLDNSETGSVTADIIVEDDIGTNGPPTTADSIVGAGTKPSITSAKYSRTTPSSWTTTTIARGSALMIELESVTTFTGLMVAVELTANEP